MEKQKKPIYRKWWFWLIVIVIVGGIGANGVNKDKGDQAKDTSKPTTGTAQKKENKKEDTKVTYENFINVKMGAKYADVVKILGEGKELSSSEVSGIKTAMYSWNGSGISNMNVTIQNGVVIGKGQVGLKEMDAKVTLEKYNKIKEGSTYDQVKAIFGDGQVMSQTKIMDEESIIYSWINKNGANMNCTFSGGKLMLKAQFNLK
ncbi:DUF3862 domain-containing protein [Clostridium lundense]|uniref:DUF3862 domain-containing protein n=1 Tax=Clostridium lundense TaxID=319475 RepID=UPI00048675AA|nr:DUF3862 domain-containing protein [Clostridium lundense]